MKFIEKLSLTIFSIIMLALSVINCLLVFGWLRLSTMNMAIEKVIDSTTYSNILLAVSVVFILLALKCIFFASNEKDGIKGGNGIILENDNGKLVVTKETLINIVNSVAKGFESTENVQTKIFMDKDNSFKIYVDIYVHSNAIIKDLSANLQTKIKEAIKKTVDIDVKEVNIRIKNIANDKVN